MGRLPIRNVPDGVVPWREQGCNECRSRWGGGFTEEPRFLGENEAYGERYFRCSRCGAYWSYGWQKVRELSEERVRADLPDLDELLRQAGVM